jgi:hypothetical protein
MKKIYFYLIGILTFSSCQYQVDNSNPFGVAEAIHEGLVRNDSTILKKVFEFQMDSFSNNSIEKMKKAQCFFKENKQIKIFKADTSSHWSGKIIDIFYKKGENFYQVRTYYKPDSTNTIKPTDFYFNNINELSEEEKNKPYKPNYSIDFKRISWSTDYYGKTFKSGAIELQNNTDLDINYIKFRIILKHGKYSWDAETFLNQTIESYKSIYKGDIATIEVPGMTDYFAGFSIKKDEMFFDTELIEIKPKPKSELYWCNILEKLQDEIIENSK